MNFFRINKIDNLSSMVKAIEKYAGFSVIRLSGSFDFNTIPPIEDIIKKNQEHLDQDVVLDFKDVTRIDTSTLAVLIYIINRLKHKHRSLSLINCNKLVKEYIRIGKLESVIRIHDTLTDALNKAKEEEMNHG